MALLLISHGSATDVGKRRSHNEDALLADDNVFAVADGVGGHAAGEVAAGLVVDALACLVGRSDLAVDEVVSRIRVINSEVLDEARHAADRRGMATTLALAILTQRAGPAWIVAHVGDSRVYRIQSGRLEQLTTDHTEVAELVAAGQLTPSQAKRYPRRHVVTRSLGVRPPLDVDARLVTAHAGDRLLLCSDGLTGDVDDAEIAAVLRSASNPQTAADALVQAALTAGGSDNVSVIVVDIADGDDRLE